MRTPSLLAVFVLARVLILIGREVPLSPWSPVAFLWQDLLVVLIFATSERLVRRAWFSGTLYAAIVLYIALNLPLTRLLSSPLTVPMLRATRGTLVDSIQHHLTWENLGLMAIVILAGVTLPFLLRRVEPRPGVTVGLTAFAVALVAFGPFATSQVETGGLHRNVFGVLLATAMPRVAATQMVANWRRSPLAAADPPYELPAKEELARFKGAAAGRNVVLILLESTGAQYLKPYGAAEDPMPNLTALAEQAILFENAYAVYPESIKGLFSVVCSRYPAIDTRPEDYLHATTPSIAARLAEAGYGTALLHSGRFLYLGMEAIIRNRGFQVLQDAGDIGGNRNSSFGVDDKATVERMLGWIDSLPQSGCFFITYLPVAGHHPYDTPTPGPFPAADEVGRYRNALHYSDAVLGGFFRGLKERSLFDKTLFVILGDHGEAFGQHEGNYGHTLFIYEENVRVPCLIVAPGLIHESIRVRRVASLIDTAPTILDLLGLPGPPTYQGTSLLEERGELALFYTDYSLGLIGLRDGPWKFIYELETGRERLFDLARDPKERRNVAHAHELRAKAYRDHLVNWASAQRDLILRSGKVRLTDDRSFTGAGNPVSVATTIPQ